MKLLWFWKFSVCQFPLKNIIFGAQSVPVIVASEGCAYGERSQGEA